MISSPGERSPNTCENFQCVGGGEEPAVAMVMSRADYGEERERESRKEACEELFICVLDWFVLSLALGID